MEISKSRFKMGSNKSFGIVFFVVFALISIYPIINGGELKKWPLLIATNRDEYFNRDFQAPGCHWKEYPFIFAGKEDIIWKEKFPEFVNICSTNLIKRIYAK